MSVQTDPQGESYFNLKIHGQFEPGQPISRSRCRLPAFPPLIARQRVLAPPNTGGVEAWNEELRLAISRQLNSTCATRKYAAPTRPSSLLSSLCHSPRPYPVVLPTQLRRCVHETCTQRPYPVVQHLQLRRCVHETFST